MKTGRGMFRPWARAVLTVAFCAVPLSAAAAQDTAPQVSCYQRAMDGGLDDSMATQLCRGARSASPADCFLRVQDEGSLSQSQSVQLCQLTAPDEDPAGCYIQARQQTFSEPSRVMQLCQPAQLYCPGFVN